MRRDLIFFLLCAVVCTRLLFISTNLSADSRVPTPLINPLGDMEAYDELEFISGDELEYWDIDYETEEGEWISHRTWGDFWRMSVPFTDDEEPLRQLSKNVQELGGSILRRTAERLICSVPGGEAEHWWAVGEYPEEGSYELSIIRERHLKPGKNLVFRPGEDDSFYRFIVTPENNRYQIIRVELPDGAIKLRASVEIENEGFTRILYFEKELSAERSTTYYLDDLPQLKARTPWSVILEEGNRPREISFTLEEVAELPVVKEGNALGVLLVRGAQFGEVRVQPSDDMVICHPGLNDDSFDGDETPEGETIFWLPPGLWDITINPESYLALERCEAGLIPVNPGEMTVVDLPEVMAAAYGPDAGADFLNRDNALQIVQAKEQGNSGEVYFTLIDQELKGSELSLDNTRVFEGGRPARILELGPVKTPPDVVLLLDSSGSMRGQMGETLSAARKFIGALPDDAGIQVVDFDTGPELLPGMRKEEVLESLDRVKADGATALYDSILDGLELLEGKDRPALLVFTDGVDANFDDSGPGSTAALPEVLERVSQANIPLFTIGFGPNHDNKVLVKLAEISGGHYYPAADREALEKVFAAINENLGSTYQLSYERPAAAGISDLPVISLVVDTSASMDISPEEEEGCGYRMQKVKNLLHDFVLALPDKSLVQLINFFHAVEMPQIMTSGKAEILKALGQLYADGGTDIFGSTRIALSSLLPLPSSRKIFIYITDAALDVQNEKEEYQKLLKQIKDQNIRSIWIGLGMEEAEDIFAGVAELTGGKYVISEEPDVLWNTFEEILALVNKEQAAQGKIPLRLAVNKESDDGIIYSYNGSKEVSFSPPPEADFQRNPDGLSYETGLPLQQGSLAVDQAGESGGSLEDPEGMAGMAAMGSYISGAVIKNIPVDAAGSNEAVEIQVRGITLSNKLAGIEAPGGRQFLTLELEFMNILPEQEVILYPDGNSHPANWLGGETGNGSRTTQIPRYLIPDLTSHCFVNLNNSSLNRVSQATWLLKSTLLKPGDFSLTVGPEQTAKGSCVFLVPEESLEQLSLHIYDTAYGNLALPLIGEITREDFLDGVTLEELPTEEPVKLSDAFSLSLRAVRDFTEIENITASDGCLFRIVEADFISRVQALLDIDPGSVFTLQFKTPKGALCLPLHPVTGYLPMGFNRAKMVAPGSYNRVRLGFMIPECLSDQPGELYVNMKKDDIVIPLSGGFIPGEEGLGYSDEGYEPDYETGSEEEYYEEEYEEEEYEEEEYEEEEYDEEYLGDDEEYLDEDDECEEEYREEDDEYSDDECEEEYNGEDEEYLDEDDECEEEYREEDDEYFDDESEKEYSGEDDEVDYSTVDENLPEASYEDAGHEEKYSAEGIELIVNELAFISQIYSGGGNLVAADLKFIDLPDDSATLINGLFELVRDDYQGVASQLSLEKATEEKGLGNFGDADVEEHFILYPDELTGELLFGVNPDTAVIDGTERRVLVVFSIPDEGMSHTWTLRSPCFPKLKLPVSERPYSQEGLLVRGFELADQLYLSFNQRLSQAVEEVIDRYQLLQAAGGQLDSKTRLDLSAAPAANPLPVPRLTYNGFKELNDIASLEDLKELLRNIQWLPSPDQSWINRYAPEAVLTQNWGTENDLAVLAERVLHNLGYQTERTVVEVSAEGLDKLKESGGIAELKLKNLPGLKYRREDSEQADAGEGLLVMPFGEDYSVLSGLVRLPEAGGEVYDEEPAAVLTVILEVLPRELGASKQLADMSTVLGGEGEGGDYEEITVFNGQILLETLSLDAVDLAYAKVGKGEGDLLTAIVETPGGRLQGSKIIDTGEYKIIVERIEIALPDRTLEYELELDEREGLEGVFHTLGVNLPDLSEEAARELQDVANTLHASTDNPEELSLLKWYTRSIIDRFIAGQSSNERDMARNLGLITGRTERPRCLVVTVRKNSAEQKMETRIDLLRVENQLHSGEKERQHAFNIFSGIFASRLEAEVIPAHHLGLFDIWQQLSPETGFTLLTAENKEEALAFMKEAGWPEVVINQLAATEEVVIIPTAPALIDGKERWAWLKINPSDYRTIAVLDTGEHGSMAEYVIQETVEVAQDFIKGFYIGSITSFWSVLPFVLVEEDLEAILEAAEALAAEIGKQLKEVKSAGIPNPLSGDLLNTKYVKASFNLEWSGELKFSKSIDGFAMGYDAAVSEYFKYARENWE